MIDDVEIDDATFAAAAERGADELEAKPRAVSARYDRQADRIAIELANGCTVLFPPMIAQDLQDATPDQLADIEVSPAGLALHWPQIDPIENVWAYLRVTKLAHRLFESYKDIVDACCDAWNSFIADPATVRSITTRQWATCQKI